MFRFGAWRGWPGVEWGFRGVGEGRAGEGKGGEVGMGQGAR